MIYANSIHMRIEQNSGGTIADNSYDVAKFVDRYMVVVKLLHFVQNQIGKITFMRSVTFRPDQLFGKINNVRQ